MTHDDFHDLLHRATDDLGPDVAGLVAGGSARGRARRRRRLVGGTAAAMVTVGAVAVGSVVLTSGGGPLAEDQGFSEGGSSLVDASVAAHDGSHRLLAEDRFADVLDAMLPDDGAPRDGGGSIGTLGSAGSGGGGGQTLSATVLWHGGQVTVNASDGLLAGPVVVAEGETPPEPTPYAGPEKACQAAQRDADEVTAACHDVDNGDWVLATAGSMVGLSGYAPVAPCPVYNGCFFEPFHSRPGNTAPGTAVPVPEGADPDGATASSDGSTVSLFTTDGWQVSASATGAEDSDGPVLGDADLQVMTQDGDWFLDPDEEPPAPQTAEPQGATVHSDGSADALPGSSVESGPSPVRAQQFGRVFASLVPGEVTEVALAEPSDHPEATFRWNGYPVRVSIKPSQADDEGVGSLGIPDLVRDPSTGTVTERSWDVVRFDGWRVKIEVTGLDADATLTKAQLSTAAYSDAWFR